MEFFKLKIRISKCLQSPFYLKNICEIFMPKAPLLTFLMIYYYNEGLALIPIKKIIKQTPSQALPTRPQRPTLKHPLKAIRLLSQSDKRSAQSGLREVADLFLHIIARR
jgi:hypothetical protein